MITSMYSKQMYTLPIRTACLYTHTYHIAGIDRISDSMYSIICNAVSHTYMYSIHNYTYIHKHCIHIDVYMPMKTTMRSINHVLERQALGCGARLLEWL